MMRAQIFFFLLKADNLKVSVIWLLVSRVLFSIKMLTQTWLAFFGLIKDIRGISQKIITSNDQERLLSDLVWKGKKESFLQEAVRMV